MQWWKINCQKADGTLDATRFKKILCVWLFSVFVFCFTTVMIVDVIRYTLSIFDPTIVSELNKSIVIWAKVGGVVIGSMILPVLDYRSHISN